MSGWIAPPFVSGQDLTGRLHDPYFASVVLLLHGDGTNGSSTITDSSSYARSITNSGCTISNAQSKFGGTSINSTGSPNYFTVDMSGDNGGLMTGDFTAEMFVRHSAPNVEIMYSDIDANNAWEWFYGSPTFDSWNSGSGHTPVLDWTTSAPHLTNTWYHVAMSRTGSALTAYTNGTQWASVTNSSTINLNKLYFGYEKHAGGGYFNGYWDEIRITKGMGRYPAAFTAPTVPFPNS